MVIRYRIRKINHAEVIQKIVDGEVVGSKTLNLPLLWTMLEDENTVKEFKDKNVKKFTKGKKKKRSENFALYPLNELDEEPSELDIEESLEEIKGIWE